MSKPHKVIVKIGENIHSFNTKTLSKAEKIASERLHSISSEAMKDYERVKYLIRDCRLDDAISLFNKINSKVTNLSIEEDKEKQS